MQTRTGLVTGMLVVGLLGATVPVFAQEDLVEPVTLSTSSDPIYDENATEPPYQTLPEGTEETIALLTVDACQYGLAVLNTQGWHAPADSNMEYEYDLLSPECREFRDTLEHRFLNGEAPPYVIECNYLVGTTCVAVGHYACDVAIVVRSGMVYYCAGGIFPYN